MYLLEFAADLRIFNKITSLDDPQRFEQRLYPWILSCALLLHFIEYNTFLLISYLFQDTQILRTQGDTNLGVYFSFRYINNICS